MRFGFHSPVMCWFVITGLDRSVLRKQPLSSPPKVYSQEIDPIDPVKSSVVYTLSVFTQTFALINGINHRLAPLVLVQQPKCKSFPAQTLITSAAAFTPPFILPGEPTLHTFHAIFMLLLRMRFHGLVIRIRGKKNPCQSLIVSCPYERE